MAGADASIAQIQESGSRAARAADAVRAGESRLRRSPSASTEPSPPAPTSDATNRTPAPSEIAAANISAGCQVFRQRAKPRTPTPAATRRPREVPRDRHDQNARSGNPGTSALRRQPFRYLRPAARFVPSGAATLPIPRTRSTRKLEANAPAVWVQLALSSDGRFAVLAGKDKALWNWDLQNGPSSSHARRQSRHHGDRPLT